MQIKKKLLICNSKKLTLPLLAVFEYSLNSLVLRSGFLENGYVITSLLKRDLFLINGLVANTNSIVQV